ncbi:MAG: phosphotransferase [Anaerolineae bacterium]|nr:phosphotransferase [Anaerolineae bacterium]
MWYETQKRLEHAITPAVAAARWGAEAGALRLVNDGINVVYRFERGGQGYYLRLVHAALRDRATLEAVLDYLRHLAGAGAAVCRPVESLAENWVEDVVQGEELFLATVVQEVAGELLDVQQAGEAVMRAWGRSLAGLHNAAESFVPRDAATYYTWEKLWEEIAGLIGKHGDAMERAEYQRVDAWLRELPRDAGSFGLTHADYRAGNMIWDGAQVHTIDFDEPVYHWYAADIARVMLDFEDSPPALREQAREWFVAGYRAVRPLAARWVDDLDWLMRMKRLGMYIWTVAERGGRTAEMDEKTVAWLAACRGRIAEGRVAKP